MVPLMADRASFGEVWAEKKTHARVDTSGNLTATMRPELDAWGEVNIFMRRMSTNEPPK
jgi:hypothetical protein